MNDQSKHARIYDLTLSRYTFRVGGPADAAAIAALWPEYWDGAHYKDRGIEPDPERYAAWLDKVITYGAEVFILALDGDEIVGFFSYGLDHNFSVRPVAVMDKFFVARAHRRSAIAPVLRDLAMQAARDDGACAFHAPITSESPAARSLANLFTKIGFTTIGSVVGRAL